MRDIRDTVPGFATGHADVSAGLSKVETDLRQIDGRSSIHRNRRNNFAHFSEIKLWIDVYRSLRFHVIREVRTEFGKREIRRPNWRRPGGLHGRIRLSLLNPKMAGVHARPVILAAFIATQNIGAKRQYLYARRGSYRIWCVGVIILNGHNA
jgi:hypothetical protein